MIEFKSVFDNEIRTKLLRQEFEDWLEQVQQNDEQG